MTDTVAKKRRFSFVRLFILLVLCGGISLAAAMFFSDHLIFQPPRHGLVPAPDMIVIPITGKINITSQYLPSSSGSGYTLLYSHGNAEDLTDLRPLLQEYVKHGFNIIAYDYEGYGASGGVAREKNCYRDIEAVYDYITVERKIDPAKIIIYGRSVGSGPACYLAEKRPAAALVLESPFMSAFRVISGPLPLPFDKFKNLNRIPAIRMPLLVFHGCKDEVIPFQHGQRIYVTANKPKKMVEVPSAGHNDLIEVAGNTYWLELERFVKSLTSKDYRLPPSLPTAPARPVPPKVP